MLKSKIAVKLGLTAFLAVQVLNSMPVLAQGGPWTSVGSAGTVDEEDLKIVRLGGPSGVVSMAPAATGTLNIRYNVVAVDGIFGGNNYGLTLRYRDDAGAGGRVVARLKQLNLATGVETTLLKLDSNSFPFAPDYQVRNVYSACGSSLNFSNNAYFVDVEIVKNAASAKPALAMMRLALSIC